jgi:DNA polymerase (family X)
MENWVIAQKLRQLARKLRKEDANLFRIRAYLRGAEAIERLRMPAATLLEQQGGQGLRELPGVGDHIAFAIERLVTTGDFHALNEGFETVSRQQNVRALPGIGPHLAEMLWEKLRIRTIAELEQAFSEHRIDQLPLTEKRRQHLWETLCQCRAEGEQVATILEEPSVADLLWVDHEYRRLARKNQLPTNTPGQSDPRGESESPLHFVRRHGWKYRAMFANTALAHRLGRSRDWVVIYFSNDKHRGQRTVVTERQGRRRVVRGREREC